MNPSTAMILRIEQVLDIGNLGKQRIMFRAVKNGNLLGYHLFQGDIYFYSFPYWEVKSGDFVVLYISGGERETKKFVDAICHFLYMGERVRLWEEQADTFRLVFRSV